MQHRRERSTVVEGSSSSCPQRRRTPSFSSSLLDAIYRSIDESKSHLDSEDHQQHLGRYNSDTTHNTNSKHTTFSHNNNNNHHNFVHNSEKGTKERMNLRRAVMIEDWMEKQSSQSFMNSSSSSSECSSGGIFSSSETDTTCKTQRSRAKTEKPLKQNVNPNSERSQQQQQKKKPQRESGFTRTKLRALKIYGELNQRVKQPISPGSRIASFLSSIFSSENVKKAKMCYVGAVEDVSFEHKSKSPCFSSSASSFSRRSCMSKTPNNKSNNGVKRSVRFYPVSVILGEDSPQPCGNKYGFENDPSLMMPPFRKITRTNNKTSIKELKNNNEDEAAARGFMKGYRNSGKFDFRGYYDNGELDEDDDEEEDDDDDDDDDDALSYSSSDLFELDHLIGAGIRYQEELPVYETTNLETNKAIANGLRL